MRSFLANYALTIVNDEFGTQLEAKGATLTYTGGVMFEELSARDHHGKKFIQLKKLEANFSIINVLINPSFINLRGITLTQPQVEVITYKGESQDNFTLFIDKFDDKKPSKKESKFRMDCQQIIVKKGKVSIFNQNISGEEKNWLNAQDVQLLAKNLFIKGSSISVEIRAFSFQSERWGEQYHLKNLSGKLEYTKQHLWLDELRLVADSTELLGSFHLDYSSPKAYSHFSEEVIWNVELLPDSKISGKTIRYFYKDWNTDAVWNTAFRLQGPLMDWKFTNLHLHSNDTYLITKSLKLKKIVKKNFEIETSSTILNTSVADLETKLPNYIPVSAHKILQALGTVRFTGDFFIDTKKLQTDGEFLSNAGEFQLNAQLNDYSSTLANYTFQLNAKSFYPKVISSELPIEKFIGQVSVEGSGYSIQTLSLKTKLLAENIVIKGKTYTQHDVFAEVDKQKLDVNWKSSDPNFIAQLEGSYDFSERKEKIYVKGNIDKWMLHHYGLSDVKGEELKTQIELSAMFSHWDDLNLSLYLNEFILKSDERPMLIPRFQLTTYETSGYRDIRFSAPSTIQGYVYTGHKLTDIPKVFMEGIGRMWVGYTSENKLPEKDLSFSIDVEDTFTELFFKDISVNYGTNISGYYEGTSKNFILNFLAPHISYTGFHADDFRLKVNTDGITDQAIVKAQKIYYKDNVIRDVLLELDKVGNKLYGVLDFFVNPEHTDFAHINFYQNFSENTLFFGLQPSSFSINGNVWSINQLNDDKNSSGSYDFNTGVFNLCNTIIYSDQAEIYLDASYENENTFSVFAELKETDLARFLPKKTTGDIELKGLCNGIINFSKVDGELKPILAIDIFRLQANDYVFGDFYADVSYNEESQNYSIVGGLTNGRERLLKLDGVVETKREEPEIAMNLSVVKLPMSFLELFLDDILSQISGSAEGELAITGNIANPSFTGTLTLKDFGFRMDYLGTNYVFEGENELAIYTFDDKPLNKGNIFINHAPLFSYDGQIKRTGSVAGIIQFAGFDKWFLSLDFQSDDLMVLNTTERDNDLFYGKVFAKGDFYLHGLANNLRISAIARALQGSRMTINSNAALSVEENKILRFRSADKTDIIQNIRSSQPTGLSIDFLVAVDEGTELRVIIDRQTRDEIVARGESKALRFRMSSSGDISMVGEYEIKTGSRYNFRTLLDKEFKIARGSKISWDGDPYNANLNVTAIYSQIVSNLGDFLNMGYVPATQVDLGIHITAQLQRPEIDFFIQLPKASNQIREELNARLQNNRDLVFQQFGSVLLFQKFIRSDTNIGSSAASSAYEVAIRQLLGFINNISPDIQLNFGFVQGDLVSQTNDQINAGVGVDISPRIRIRSSVGIPLRNQINPNERIIAEGEVEYDFSKRNDGTWLLRGFSRPSTFGIDQFNNGNTFLQSFGVGIGYKKSFNSFYELFHGKKKPSDSIKK